MGAGSSSSTSRSSSALSAVRPLPRGAPGADSGFHTRSVPDREPVTMTSSPPAGAVGGAGH